ncbi:MAG: chemotaxis response regulator protein-glutamate methylesterase [Gammaproteobacteria bacterium]|nr:chemotaxis response regulator protein-glutamate methylesterase [Gammaproteobacteria bacterium]
MKSKKIRVLVIDDSALIRRLLPEILSQDRAIDVVGTASDPYVARDKIKQLKPDVLTLDVEMPKMDGVTFLRNLMRLRPMPVVMVSSLTEAGAEITLEALEIGAVDYVAKPKIDLSHSLGSYADELISKVKAAASARIRSVPIVRDKGRQDAAIEPRKALSSFKTTEKLIAIGASTGGTEAIKDVLIDMPAASPGIVITQHIPEQFSAPFAKRMNAASAMTVCEAADGQQILPGHVYIAPGKYHLLVERSGARYVCRLDDGERVNRHKPSVDVLFRSVAQNVGCNAISVLLTGMGNDGAKGMLEMKEAGALTIAQDEKTSVVWGMPGEAVKLGCVDKVVPLHTIVSNLMRWIA